MKFKEIKSELINILGPDNVYFDEPMKNHTSFKIGGPAKILVTPETIENIQQVVSLCKNFDTPYMIIGNGSNLLVNDEGIDKVVIKIAGKMAKVTIDVCEQTVVAEPGVLLSTLSNLVAEKELTGFEFASGIPGTLGGAVFMNAGAYGGEMQDVVTSVTILDEDGQVKTLTRAELEFAYRSSVIQKKNGVVLSVKLNLSKGNSEDIQALLKDLTYKRTSKQPLELPSAGSTFKRPEGYFAGKLIEDAGLIGFRYGGAAVSSKHAGFVVNVDRATFHDVMTLIGMIQKIVFDRFGVVLETEVKIIDEK